MPPLAGFSDNPLRTRADVAASINALLAPLTAYQSASGSRIRIPVATGAHFDEVAAQVEGFARPLWVVAALIAGNGGTVEPLLKPWISGIAAGTNPASGEDEFWGEMQNGDQRMVETEIIGFALLTAPEAFLPPADSKDPADEEARRNIVTWIRSINGKWMPPTNWLWFRVMANLALVKSCGVPYDELKDSMNADLAKLDTYYMGDGWSSDGVYDDNRRQADYYSGSFAIQFSQLLYVKHAADLDPVRVEKYKQRARDFALDFWRYFDADGAAIPFGRSLTYRFAFAGFWSAAVLAEVELPEPLSLGVVKGILLRHLRWWTRQDDMFNADGTLNIGFCYPNMYMSEDYNSPQSVYWCMKSFVAIALPEDHIFWTTEELPYPVTTEKGTQSLEVASLRHPKQILCNSSSHHFLLSSGQSCEWPLKATEAKYSKFAYSSLFGFSVPTGPLIQQMAPDSTLALSIDGGDSWKVRWKSLSSDVGKAKLLATSGASEDVPALTSTWAPFKRSSLLIHTTLIAPSHRWPDWHIRVHRISWNTKELESLSAVEGGFANLGRILRTGKALPEIADLDTSTVATEGTFQDSSSALVVSEAGASGIVLLTAGTESKISSEGKGVVLKPDSNTNLMWQRTLIPTIQLEIDTKGANDEGIEKTEMTISTAVFGTSTKNTDFKDVIARWKDVPVMQLGGDATSKEACIQLD